MPREVIWLDRETCTHYIFEASISFHARMTLDFSRSLLPLRHLFITAHKDTLFRHHDDLREFQLRSKPRPMKARLLPAFISQFGNALTEFPILENDNGRLVFCKQKTGLPTILSLKPILLSSVRDERETKRVCKDESSKKRRK